MSAPAQQAGMISIDQVAKLLMMTAARVGQLVKAGYIPKATRGSYPIVGVVQGYIRFLKEDERRSSKSAAQSRFQDAKARQVELANAEREGKLGEVEEFFAIMDHVLGLLKTGLSGLPARVTRDLAERRKIEDEISAIYQAAATAFEHLAEQLETRGVVLNAEPEDDAG